MLLSLETTLRSVFMVYGAFWIVLLIALFVGVGALSRKRERILARQHQEPGAHH